MEDDIEEILGTVEVPRDGGAMSLFKCGDQFTLRVHDRELMSSGAHESEDRLAALACAKLAGVSEPVVLIGGLGMGYTLAAALKGAGPGAKIILAELVPAVVKWNRGPLAHLAGNPLSDPRVSVRIDDVRHSIRTGPGTYDAILLDVDNGPEGLTRGSNDWLYSEEGLSAAYTALRLNGVLAVWSATPDSGFAMRLRKLGFEVEEVLVPSSADDKAYEHTIWLATKRP